MTEVAPEPARPTTRAGRPARWELLLALALYVMGACVFFRQQIWSGFDVFFGDRGDARLILFIHEHVYRALRGETVPPAPVDASPLGLAD